MSLVPKQLIDISQIPTDLNLKVAIVYTEWNADIVAEQMKGAQRIADQLGVQIVHSHAVPGSVEIPFACKRIFEATQGHTDCPDAIITFGAVIKGETAHFEYVCKMLTDGIHILNMSLPIPVIFGVLTTYTTEQIWDRLGGKYGHKGEEAMITAVKMILFNASLAQ